VAPPLLLASSSPRRRELLAAAGFQFESVFPKVDERFPAGLTLREITALNAVRKALAVARHHPEAIVLAADTLVALDDEVIGKPADRADAFRMLRCLSGKRHQVSSSVFITHLGGARSLAFDDLSHVRFHRLSAAAIDRYLEKVNPLDKAGAYAAQGEGREIISAIEGSYTNVVGLPMEKTVAALARFGLRPAKA
jgi:septum formation protein